MLDASAGDDGKRAVKIQEHIGVRGTAASLWAARLVSTLIYGVERSDRFY